MWPSVAFFALVLQATPDSLLSRVTEEASIFQQNMPEALSQETLQQRSLLPPSRFRPRTGNAVNDAPKLRLRVREIVSEYSVGHLKDSDSTDLVEFRQVISVDGKPVQSADAARRALSLDMQSADDRIRKRMLEEFAKNGLVDIATDYGLILLAFTPRGIENMTLQPAGETQIGADRALGFAWKQKTAAGGELEFHGRQAAHRALQGMLWVRAADGLPLRISAFADHIDPAHHEIRDEATVDYAPSAHGFLTPASVVHRHIVDRRLITENLYRYAPFKLFSADADIKFTEIPDMPPAAPPAPVKKK
ncbi:MAG TPA: hypothetical protein VN736_19855 [Candidatus Limnocylindrales bacterium]|nr:hypothetical protein [Candidatus Limnocylindrales bacterium]